MYYNTPKVERYVAFILKNRVSIISAYFLLLLITFFLYQPKILSSDAMFWLNESKEFQKTKQQKYDTFLLTKLFVHVEVFNDTTKKELQKIHDTLLHTPGVKEVSSLFSHTIIKHEKNKDSSMLGVFNVGGLGSYEIKKYVDEASNPYANFVDKGFHTFYFYINSTVPLDIKKLNIKKKYELQTTDNHIEKGKYLFYIFSFIVILIVVFRAMFSNFVSSFNAIIVVCISTFFSFAVIDFLTGIDEIYMIIPFISFSISLVDYLFFYHRWHVSQYKADKKHALVKMLNRNLTPALWTSVLTTLGLGSLVFMNSDIVKLLSLSVIVSSIITYLVNLTLLPAILSYFKLKHAHIHYAKICYAFASNELHYNKKYLITFLVITTILFSIGAYKIYEKSNSFFKLHVKNDQLVMMVPYDKIDLNTIKSLQQFSEDITTAFAQSIDEVKSLSGIIQELNDANSQTQELNDQALQQALFYLDLYGLDKEYYDENAIKIVINIFEIDKFKLIKWLKNYQGLHIYFVDQGTLLNNAMHEKTILLSISLFSALVIIGLITGWIFRAPSMAFVGFMVNAIPIVWFGVIVKILDMPLSFEMLIAMTISVGLTSDATIHFAFKYFRSRYFGRTPKHSLDKMFFYSGIPVIFGSFVLIGIFTLLSTSDLSSLRNIGLYSALLVLMSLLTDLFILPVTLLFLDDTNKFSKKAENNAI